MSRLIYALSFLLTNCAVLAAPAPKDSWKRIDPDKDCKIVIKDDTMTIELPGGDHDLSPKRKRCNAPRIFREVEGDFVMQVRVCSLFRLSDKSSVDGEEPRVAAGLVVMPANKEYIGIEYASYRKMGDQHISPSLRSGGVADFVPEGHPSLRNAPPAQEEHAYLRCERQGNSIHQSISFDGKKWVFSATQKPKSLPKEVKVGLAAYSSSTAPFRVRFDEFKFSRGKKKDK